MTDYPDVFSFSISHTTRCPRKGEEDGVNYYFTEKTKFEELLKQNEFIEFNNYSGNYYGTSIAELNRLKKLHKICILDVDINGAINISKTTFKPNFIAVLPPSVEVLSNRLLLRNSEDAEKIQKRIQMAPIEIEQITKSGLFEYQIINDKLDESFQEFKSAVLKLFGNLEK